MINAAQLTDELIAAGVPMNGLRTDGSCIYTRTPTQAELGAEALARTAHDPTKRERDDIAERTGIRSVVDDLIAATTDAQTWANLTAAQRTEATRRGLRALAMMIRRLVR